MTRFTIWITIFFPILSICFCQTTFAPNPYHQSLDPLILEAITQRVTPGAVGIVGNAEKILYASALGNYTFGIRPPYVPNSFGSKSGSPPTQLDTLFDLASCSKIVGATTGIALLYQQGKVDLNTPVSHFLGTGFNSHNKENITVLNCLLHNAGYPPDPNPLYYSQTFACPETLLSEKEHRNPTVTFSCQSQIFQSLLDQTLQYPTGTDYVYSDLSFITLMNIVGALAKQLNEVEESELIPDCMTASSGNSTFQCYFEAYMRTKVWPRMQMGSTGFLPPRNVWGDCAPAENSTDAYYIGTWQGQVSDENAYAMGGIAGHAGVFSNALDLIKYARQWLFADDTTTLINSTTAHFFRKDYDPSLSSRALGFNTCNPNVKDKCWNFSCGTLSPDTFMHIGYTGTEICMDPEREIFTILLTNRVYPDDTHSSTSIHNLRYNFNTNVQKVFDSSN